MKRIFAFFLIICFVALNTSAETIRLKTGGEIEGKIIERTDEYIKIDFQGNTLTYWLDEIHHTEKEADGSLSAELEVYQGPKKNFLWKVDSDNSTVYILGSIHVARDDLYLPFK